MTNTTIAAISTPLGPGGIGIIRISGPEAYTIMQRLFVRIAQGVKRNQTDPCNTHLLSHVVYYGNIIEPTSGNVIDEVLGIYMQGPKSFTREDVVEIHSHAGYVVLDRILSAVVDAGAELSAPGEFTKRAFLNGRIDLTQAEAVIDLINAPCETAAQMASGQLAGGLRNVIEGIVDHIKRLMAGCEASIEFAETDHERQAVGIHHALKDSILPEILALIKRQKETAVFREGALLAIAGAPNVGKSSLLNQLVERETAIVSDVPGTTRDIVRDYFSINGVPVVLCDTAGIHDTQDPVECIGIEKARDHCRRADLVLLVVEATRQLNEYEEQLVEEFNSTKTIAVINKDDLADTDAVIHIRKKLAGVTHLRVSAKLSSGIDELKEMIFNHLVAGKDIVGHEHVSPNLRQRKILDNASQAIRRCILSAEQQQPPELVSEKLNDILCILQDICGNRNQKDLYDYIFSQFCIGK